MYALIYDNFDPLEREKTVVSLHRTRTAAEMALRGRQLKLGKRVWECNTRIVWVHDTVHRGEKVTGSRFDTWAPDEQIPRGDRIPDGD